MKTLLLASLMLLVSSCSNLHTETNHPPRYIKGKDNTLIPNTEPQQNSTGLIPATTVTQAKKNIEIYRDWYQQENNRLKSAKDYNGDFSLFSGIVGVVGGVFKSTESAIAGALGTSGSSIVNNRYQIDKQAENYARAVKTFECMELELIKATDDDFTFPGEVTPDINEVNKINRIINGVKHKLEIAQSSLELTPPDLTEFTTALEQFKKDKLENNPEDVQVDQTLQKSKNQADLEEFKKQITEQKQKQINLYIDALVTCKAGF